ncbi:dihydrofolate reductase [Rhodohalobacter sulfatireducens]|uniref:Dihydrofolate reductase n=1 Tax=Rhodohalobacter sulfatireducens TaxID=2911366 RepID=A0ABS9KF72_9BACT|nr:dihydrofolate reductase [Rhodohalobacter sulfatireducens]MCG2589499.1 dihydrofolate reductase [Rhodohalobacter sulfatireducens]
MKLSIIVAHDPNLVIGKDGELPWHFSEDLKFFKKTTMGSPMLMGRGVFEELNEKPLPGRENVVLSRSKNYEHVPTFSSIDKALDYLSDQEQVFIIGGGEIYRQTIDQVDELIITQVKTKHEGDTYFPEYRDEICETWKETWREDHEEFSFVKYQRVG